MTQTGMMLGSVPYMSPEQFLGDDVDHRADIYSLGVVMYEMLVGSPPFTGTIAEIMKGHLNDEPVPPSKISPDIPDIFDDIVLKCLEKDRDARYSSGVELLESIRSVITPAPLFSLIGVSFPKYSEEDIHEDRERMVMLCNNCGYAFDISIVEDSVICPACGHTLSVEESRAVQTNEMEQAQKFASQFDLSMDLDLNIRYHEYRRRVRPHLEEMYNVQCQMWEQVISTGSVISPLNSPKDEEEKIQILNVIKSLFSAVRFWNYVVARAFIVSGYPENIFSAPTKQMPLEIFRKISVTIPLDEERYRSKYINGLLGRAYQLLGLYHTIKGSQADEHEDMKTSYATAAKWFEMAKECFRNDYPEHAISAEFSHVLSNVIAHYCDDADSYQQSMKSLVPSVLNISSSMNWVLEDIKVARLYENAHETFGSLIVGAQKKIEDNIKQASLLLDERDDKMDQLKSKELSLKEKLVGKQREIQVNFEKRVSRIKRVRPWIMMAVIALPVILSALFAYLIPRVNNPLLVPVYLNHQEIFAEILVSIVSGYLLGKLTKGIPGWTDLILVLYIGGVVYLQLIPWPVAVGLTSWLIALYITRLGVGRRNILVKIAILVGMAAIGSTIAFMWMRIIDGVFMILGALVGFYIQREIIYAEYEALQRRGEQLREAQRETYNSILQIRREMIDLATRTNNQVKKIIRDEIYPVVENLMSVSKKYSLILLRSRAPEDIGNLEDIQSRIRIVEKRLISEDKIKEMSSVSDLPLWEEIPEEAVYYQAPRPFLVGIKLSSLIIQIFLVLVIMQGIALASGKHLEKKRGLDLFVDVYKTYRTIIVRPTPTPYLPLTPVWKRAPTFTPTPIPLPTPTPRKPRTATPGRTPTRIHRLTPTLRPTYARSRDTVIPPSRRIVRQVFYVTAQRLNVRQGPGTNYHVINQLVRGQKVVVVGLNRDRNWSYIESPVVGWVSSKYISQKAQTYCFRGYVIRFVNQPNSLNEIYGKVLDSNGRGIRDLRMKVYVPFYEDQFHDFCTTDKDGSFYWAGLNPQNEYAVEIINPPYRLISPLRFRYGGDHQRAIIEFRVTTCP